VEESESQARSLMSSLEMAKKKMEADDERVKDLTEQNRQLVESNDEKSGTIETVFFCSIL
jgi:pantothenate synthetase